MLKNTLTTLSAAVLLIWAVGCSDNPLETAGDTPNLADEFGGYTAATETPGFGDSELIADESEEEEVDDPILASPEMTELTSDVDAGIFHFRVVWGRIPYDESVVEATDWTGSLTMSRGGIVVRRLIRFELNQDYYLPRSERTLVEWISATTVHNDGLAVDLFVPPVRPTYDTSWVDDGQGGTVLVVDTIMPEPVTLTFATGPYTRTFTLEELAALEDVVELDDGNKVAFHGFQMFRQKCPRGILVGHWGYDVEGRGVFRGRWHSRFGYVIGYLRGHYGQNDEGRNVFYGKWIDRDGRCEGLLRGTWGYRPDVANEAIEQHRAPGWFAGRIFDAERNLIGGMAGHYGSAPDIRGGWFQGRWKLFCDGEPETDNGYDMMDDGFSGDGPI